MPKAMTTPKYTRGDRIRTRVGLHQGVIEGEPRLILASYWYRVRFNERIDTVAEEDLVPQPQCESTIRELAAERQWGSISSFRVALALERLTHANENTFYSYRSQRILFQAYQYKPLLKFLESPDQRLLIADEVGVGKTIESGLILAELEARMDLKRVLILCPSRLREKWRDEMGYKFDQDFQIAGRPEIEEFMAALERNPGRPRNFRFVVSMQTLRDEELLSRFLDSVEWIELVVVDEAHHARNPQTKTSSMLTKVCSRASAALLLTATPIHLGNQDLFTLLAALRASEFSNLQAFDETVRRFENVHDAALRVRSQSLEQLPEISRLLRSLYPSHGPDPIARKVLEDLEQVPPIQTRDWVRLERRIQDLHPLANIVTRTRKRDVHENAPKRVVEVVRCKWTTAESEAYCRWVGRSDRLGWLGPGLAFGHIQRARQAASCLPAALRWTDTTAPSEEEAIDLIDPPSGDDSAKKLFQNRFRRPRRLEQMTQAARTWKARKCKPVLS